MFIDTVPESEAEGAVAELYEADRRADGYVHNYTKLFSHRPEVFQVWRRLAAAIRAAMGLRRYELATVAAARHLRSSYCSLAHGKVLRDQLFDTSTMRDIAVDHRSAGLDPVDVAVMDFAERVAADAGTISTDDVDKLRQVGLSDAEIFDVALAAAARCFFSKVLDAMGALPDAAFRALEPELQEVLTVGRPIATD